MQKKLDESLPGGEVINRANIFGFVGIYPATRHVVWTFRGTQGPDYENWVKYEKQLAQTPTLQKLIRLSNLMIEPILKQELMLVLGRRISLAGCRLITKKFEFIRV